MNTPHRLRAEGPDHGATLIEILVAIVILSSVGVGVLTSLAAATTGASVQRDIATAQSTLATAGDALTGTSDDYVGCDVADPSAIAESYGWLLAEVLPDGPVVDVSAVRFWDGSRFGDDCRMSAGHRLQQIELSTTIDDETSTLTVVKRPVASPTIGVEPIAPADVPTEAENDGSATVEITPGLDGS